MLEQATAPAAGRFGRCIDWLSATRVIICFFVAMLVTGALIYPLNQMLDGHFLELLPNQKSALAALAQLSDSQRSTHLVGTLVADTLYPITYGGFLAGLAARCAGRFARFAVWPALITVVADFAENTLHVLALTGHTNWLGAKDVITPLKFNLFTVAAALAIVLLIGNGLKALARRINRPSA